MSTPEARFWQRLMVRRPPRQEAGALAMACARLGLLGLAALAAAGLALLALSVSALAPPPPAPKGALLLEAARLPASGGMRLQDRGQPLWLAPGPDGRWLGLDLACPQMGCVVAGPLVDGGFACPCCGSRFGSDGRLLSGPAPAGLARVPVQRRGVRLLVGAGP